MLSNIQDIAVVKAEQSCFRTENNKRSLQAQAVSNQSQKRKRASRFASSRGSVTVEAAMILPLFLAALCALIMIGQLLLAEGEIQHAVSKTAMVYARDRSMSFMDPVDGTGDASGSPALVFISIFQGGDLCSSCIAGGRTGIAVRGHDLKERASVSVDAAYSLRLPLPFFGGLYARKTIRAVRRTYTGYTLHAGEREAGDDPVVFLAEHGSVYHTKLSCSHISLRIRGNSLTIKMLEARGIRRCHKCIKKTQIPKALYITAEGDCYHSKLSCSGLKRSVRSVRLSEVRGMRQCSRCAMNSGK